MQSARGVVGIAARDYGYTAFWKSFFGMEKPRDTVLLCTENVLTSAARNQIAAGMLKSSAEWLFFMDDDMLYPSLALIRLLHDRVDVVGGTYFQRFAPHPIVAYEYGGKDEKGLYQYRPIQEEWERYAREHKDAIPIGEDKPFVGAILGKDGLMEVGGIGTGCLLIKRKVLERVGEPWFGYQEGGSEDLYFCRRAREVGFKVHVDLGVVCGHISKTVAGPIHNLKASGVLK